MSRINRPKIPCKNGVKGANKNDASEKRTEKRVAIKKRKKKESKQKKLFALKKKKRKVTQGNLPEGLKVKGYFGD